MTLVFHGCTNYESRFLPLIVPFLATIARSGRFLLNFDFRFQYLTRLLLSQRVMHSFGIDERMSAKIFSKGLKSGKNEDEKSFNVSPLLSISLSVSRSLFCPRFVIMGPCFSNERPLNDPFRLSPLSVTYLSTTTSEAALSIRDMWRTIRLFRDGYP